MPAPVDSLSDLLHRADPAAAASSRAHHEPTAFSAAVHARLRAASAPPLGLRAAFARHLLPLAAALALLASLGIGSSLAYADARRDHVESHAAAFARSIDPWLMHAHRNAASGHAGVHP